MFDPQIRLHAKRDAGGYQITIAFMASSGEKEDRQRIRRWVSCESVSLC